MLWGAISLLRHDSAREFDDRDQAFLESVSPLITDVLQAGAMRPDAHAGAPVPRGAETQPGDHYRPGVLCIHRTGAISHLTPSARYWLQEVTSDREQHLRGGLPDIVWLAVSALEQRHDPSSASKPVVHMQSRSGIWLTIEAFRAPSGSTADAGDVMVVIGPSSPDEIVELRERLYGLSERERQIAEMVIRGLSTRQISRELSIAESTVQGHLTHIFDKVQVDSRRSLIQRLLIDQLFPGTAQERAPRH